MTKYFDNVLMVSSILRARTEADGSTNKHAYLYVFYIVKAKALFENSNEYILVF